MIKYETETLIKTELTVYRK